MSMNEVVKKLSQAIDKQADKAKTTAYDTPATVRRIEGDTAWVHIPGGVDETPVKMTISAKEGDTVQVRVSGGSAFIVGNGTNPPTDDARANQAYTVATVAEGAAENALANASRAKEAADSAQVSASAAERAAGDAVIAAGNAQTAAGNAQQSADSALVSLSTVQDVVGVLNWITAHGTMTLTSDVTVNPAHVYFVVDPAGDYVVGGTHYSIVSDPKDAELSTYYELTVDESVQNYVATHIVVDSEGLWIVPDSGGNKVLIATGAGSTYTTAGTYIVGTGNVVLASFTAAGAQIGQSTEGNTVLDSSGVSVKRNGTTLASFATGGSQIGQDGQQRAIVSPGQFSIISEDNVSIFDAEPSGNPSSFIYTVNEPASGNSHTLSEIPVTGTTIEVYAYIPELGGVEASCSFTAGTSGTQTIGMSIDDPIISYNASTQTLTATEQSPSWPFGYFTKIIYSTYSASVDLGIVTVGSRKSGSTYGNGTFTVGRELVAENDSQVSIGRYNDNQSGNAFEIGNGTADNARSNALTVDWSGNVEAAGDITDGSGNTLSDKEALLSVSDDYISGISANTWYYNGTRSVAKTGYTPLAVVGWQLNQAGLHLYKLKLNGTTMEYGIALNQNSGTMASVRFDFQVLYRKV